MNKKAISPLIATVLILGFTVALAAVIMTWGQSFTKNIQKNTEETSNIQITCATDVSFSITDACIGKTDNKKIQITISNDASKKINSFKIRAYESPSIVNTVDTGSNGVDPFDVSTIIADFGADQSNAKEVEAFPVVTIAGKSVSCSSNIDSFGDKDGTTPLPTCS